jgi:hypothetical protein
MVCNMLRLMTYLCSENMGLEHCAIDPKVQTQPVLTGHKRARPDKLVAECINGSIDVFNVSALLQTSTLLEKIQEICAAYAEGIDGSSSKNHQNLTNQTAGRTPTPTKQTHVFRNVLGSHLCFVYALELTLCLVFGTLCQGITSESRRDPLKEHGIKARNSAQPQEDETNLNGFIDIYVLVLRILQCTLDAPTSSAMRNTIIFRSLEFVEACSLLARSKISEKGTIANVPCQFMVKLHGYLLLQPISEKMCAELGDAPKHIVGFFKKLCVFRSLNCQTPSVQANFGSRYATMNKCPAFILMLLHMIVSHFSRFEGLEDLCDAIVNDTPSETVEQKLRSDLIALFFWYFTEPEAIRELLSILEDGFVTSVNYNTLQLPWKSLNIETIFPNCPNFRALHICKENIAKIQESSHQDNLITNDQNRRIIALRFKPHEWHVLLFLGMRALQKFVLFKLDTICGHRDIVAVWEFLLLFNIPSSVAPKLYPWECRERIFSVQSVDTKPCEEFTDILQKITISCLRAMTASKVAIKWLSTSLERVEFQHKVPRHLLMNVVSKLSGPSALNGSQVIQSKTSKQFTPTKPVLDRIPLQSQSKHIHECLQSKSARGHGPVLECAVLKFRVAPPPNRPATAMCNTPPGSPVTRNRKYHTRHSSACDIGLHRAPKARLPKCNALEQQLRLWSETSLESTGNVGT